VLPEGVYDCTLNELKGIFSNIPNNIIRTDLYNRLLKYIDQVNKADLPCRNLLIDGSFVTQKQEPSDIDLALVLDFDESLICTPIQYSQDYIDVMHKDNVKSKYGFQIFPVFSESSGYDDIVKFFKGMKPPNQEVTKGILRVKI